MIPGEYRREDFALYSESQGRLVVTVNPKNAEAFHKAMGTNRIMPVGVITPDNHFTIDSHGKRIVQTSIEEMIKSYKSTFKDY
jgi:phosphoribosylformylglycinamidine synthase